ncbi:hypothetical protein MACJ_003248 [Theileria orientalis]|uniref:23S rRNA methyltransferase n=1 Tax=Theileria orientalis TaxID=68886 RepID=A0A976QT00_THEOR|nr:hypothetical protein MACJ_003248 [Theileria orientalis]
MKRKIELISKDVDSYLYEDICGDGKTSRTLISKKDPYKNDFLQLSKHYPILKKHMTLNLRWKPLMPKSLMYHYDFNHPDSVYHLSKAILKHNYNMNLYLPCECSLEESCNMDKDLDEYNQYLRESTINLELNRFLAPCVPNRISYIRAVSGLLSKERNHSEELGRINEPYSSDRVLKGNQVLVLDVGTGASCIYPLVGVAENSWSFIGTDINSLALEVAKKNIDLNDLGGQIKLRLQSVGTLMFHNVLNSTEFMSLTLCNPPFHSSMDKTNLNPRTTSTGMESELVFSVPQNEVQTIEQSYMDSLENKIVSVEGSLKHVFSEVEQGEASFIEVMLKESKFYCHNALWFTSLVAKLTTLKKIKALIQKEMRMYLMNHKQQEQFLNTKLEGLTNKNNSMKFTQHTDKKVEVSQIHIYEFRTFTLKLGKQSRWAIAWTYYNSNQRVRIIEKLNSTASQQEHNQ